MAVRNRPPRTDRLRVRRTAWVLVCVSAVGCLSYQEFLTKRHDKYCEQQTICNPDIDCNIPIGLDTGYGNDDCSFDGSAAHDCLHGSWTCADIGSGFEYPLAPQACGEVCGAVTTSTGGR